MTNFGPGVGGVPDRPPGYTPPDQPGVAAGSPNVIRARQVIIVGANGELLIYNPTVATGNLVVSATGPSGTGLAGDTVQAGVTVYAAGGFPFAQLNAGVLNFQATSGQFAPGIVESFGVAGEVGITSGLATNTDSAANMIIDSAQASGLAQSLVSLQAAITQVTGNLQVTGTGSSLGGSTSTGAGDNGGVTSGPSGTVNAFPAAGPNHTHAEVHHHPYHA